MPIDKAATRDALARLASDGSDLSRPMVVDFFVAVPDEAAGTSVATRVAALGFAATVEQDDETREWTCYCSKRVVPELDIVVAMESQLDAIGREYGGYGDGFGSFGNG